MRIDASRVMLVVAVAVTFTARVVAHDLWLIPPGATKQNEKATVSAVSGNKFPNGDHAPDPSKFAKRIVIDPDGVASEADAAGTEAKAGLLMWTPAKSGVYASRCKRHRS